MDEMWLWFCMIPGLYRNDKQKILEKCSDPWMLKTSSEKAIREMTFLKEKQINAILQHQKKENEELFHILYKKGIRFIHYQEKEYPEKLLQIADFPYGLFVKGRVPFAHERCIAVVGARMCTNYGRKMAEIIAEQLGKHKIAVVSGMALGIDGIAQSKCLETGTPSFSCVGGGCDICYPREHIELYQALQQNGGIISEFCPGTTMLPSHFPQRNRLISGLCDTIIVVEAKKKSGSLITADQALEQGRDIFAVPGRVGDTLSEGCNQLIEQGAGIISDVDMLMKNLGIDEKITKEQKKSDNYLAICENMVYICLDFHGKSLENIVDCTKYSEEEVLTALMHLQLKGLVVETSKNRYALK